MSVRKMKHNGVIWAPVPEVVEFLNEMEGKRISFGPLDALRTKDADVDTLRWVRTAFELFDAAGMKKLEEGEST